MPVRMVVTNKTNTSNDADRRKSLYTAGEQSLAMVEVSMAVLQINTNEPII